MSTVYAISTVSTVSAVYSAMLPPSLMVYLCTDINYTAFVLFWHQQCGFCFVLISTMLLLFSSCINHMNFVLFWLTTRLLFCSNVNNMAVKLTTADKARRGCMNLHIPGSHQTSLAMSSDGVTDNGGTWVQKNGFHVEIHQVNEKS